MRFLFALFVVLPVLEMWLLIEVGGLIGSLPTIGMVVFTAVVGAALLKQQGIETLTRAQQRLSSGQVPATEILEGLLLAVGGALLLTPGFITDTLGFVCLIGPLRQWLVGQLLKRGVMQVNNFQTTGFQSGSAGFTGTDNADAPVNPTARRDTVIIEGDYKKEE
ncbi:FxsA cytoplasmic membrane family protein [gamma proteobacterium BDW918]|uniref:Biotin--acetyl-CoA-carboxylase ligase n=1 Tax=Zhongshania aliphaticivorans TaxID=1470434 RepID=A0A127M873_9GAMM|nr:FxsA family protein [Zhongshania aliphaticivorans]AMO69411.1 biotin--acetyl-CoA-carboxylase ligase [Zhongshania aliphaticivorans]EIF42506.1 FxsA cytoplasmic membrane family protein [gamma proteobacterium BDW918]